MTDEKLTHTKYVVIKKKQPCTAQHEKKLKTDIPACKTVGIYCNYQKKTKQKTL